MRFGLHVCSTLFVCISSPAGAAVGEAATQGEINACRAIENPVERAGCYDLLFGGPNAEEPEAAVAAPGGTGDAGLVADAAETNPLPVEHTNMAIRWELDPGTNRGLWLPRGHRRTYVLPIHWTDNVNHVPESPTQPASSDGGLTDPVEVKFQLSLKVKAADDIFDSNVDLWLGYTQQSNWQVYNNDLSRPFRETNYEPEVFATLPFKFHFLGLTARMLNVGLLHQSNGQADPRSRSWNRAYAQLGIERGAFSLLIRPWLRIDEPAHDDNNPDITSYVGNGDLLGIWSKNDYTVSLMVRNSFEGDWHGAGQLDYSFPLVGNLKGYVQVFSGYGESLIDYNHKQTTIGLGVVLMDLL